MTLSLVTTRPHQPCVSAMGGASAVEAILHQMVTTLGTIWNASRLNIRPDVGVVMGGANMCGREEPDGCSVSSGSDESLIDIVTKD